MVCRLFLFLLESPQGHPVQFWSIDGKDLVRIGRASDNDVVIPHPCVSRAHAYLVREECSWRVTSLSSLGIVYRSSKHLDLPLGEGDVFRLGTGGPYLRFSSEDAEEANQGQTTMPGSTDMAMILALDQNKLTREVTAITEDAYFQQLQASIRKLRGP
jgi:pSer/pThr/pTyr-binding forkhead associated (FHA) protein